MELKGNIYKIFNVTPIGKVILFAQPRPLFWFRVRWFRVSGPVTATVLTATAGLRASVGLLPGT